MNRPTLSWPLRTVIPPPGRAAGGRDVVQGNGQRSPRTLLEQLIREREQTYEEQVKAFVELARRLDEPATMTVRHLQRLASGERSGERATPSTRRVMREFYGRGLDELLGPPAAPAAPVAALPVPRQAPDLDLDQLVTLTDNADALAQLTVDVLADPLGPAKSDVVPEVWQATVVRWLLQPAPCTPSAGSRGPLRQVDIEVVRSATRMLAGWDYQFGGGRSRMLVAQCLATEALPLARQASSASWLGREYLSAVAALARLAGWSAYDIGSHGTAQRYLALALNLALEADDRALGGRILAGMSHQANYLGQHQRAVELARAAHEGSRGHATPTALSLFHAMEARALAALGDETRCAQALTRAEEALRRGDPENDPEWVRFFDAAELHAEFAHCFRDLGQAHLACEHARHSIAESESIYVRSLSFCRTVLATAHLGENDLEQALDVANGVVETACQLRSRRVLTYLGDFRSRLAPYGSDPLVVEFDEHLRTCLPELELPPAAAAVASA